MNTKSKNILQFFALPITMVIAATISITLFAALNSIGLIFTNSSHLIIYVFLGGYLYSKIENKKVKVYSALLTSLLLICSYAFLLIGDSDFFVFTRLLAFPSVLFFQAATSQFIPEDSILSNCISALFSALPVIIVIISSKAFTVKNKKLKTIFLIILSAICIFSLCNSVKAQLDTGDFSMYRSYYDVNGVKHESNSDVPYYDIDGNVYHWIYDEEKDEGRFDVIYCGELVDESGNIYDIETVYINAEGYIFIDKNDELFFRDDLPDDTVTGWNYKDKDGNIYTNLLGIDYMEDGTPFTAMGDEYRTK